MATATSPSHPRFRADLVAEPIDEGGQRYIDVIDPDTGSAFRFYEVEYSLACAMDGERDVVGLATWAQEELGITPTSNELSSVIATLGDLGYLDAGAPAMAMAMERGGLRPVPQDDDLGFEAPEPPPPPPPKSAAATLGGFGRGRAPSVPPPDPERTPPGGISVDLSADMGIGASDVQEAVRASKVMRAAVQEPEPVSAREPRAPVTPREIPGGKRTRKASAAPRETQRVRAQADPTLGRTSPVLIVLLVVVLLGAGGYAFWKYYWTQRDVATVTNAPGVAPVRIEGSGASLPSAPRTYEAVIAQVVPAAIDIAAPTTGAIKPTAATGAVVNQGDLIAVFAGTDRLIAGIRDLNTRIERVTRELDGARVELADAESRQSARGIRRGTARVKDREDSLARKQQAKTELEAQLEVFVVRAPAGGTLEVIAAAGKRVAANDVIARIQPATRSTASFDVPAGSQLAIGDSVELTLKAPAEPAPATVTCTVAEIAAGKLVASCPPEGAPDGAAVVLP